MASRQERLLEVLAELGGSAGNKRLREALGWQEETYDQAKAALLADGRVAKGAGKGGSIRLATEEVPIPHAPSPEPPRPKLRSRSAERAAPVPVFVDFRQTFRALDNVLRQEAAQTTELDYTEQTSWMLFLKYLEHREEERADEAALAGRQHRPILDEAHRWSAWAAPRRADGQFDHDRALTGDDLLRFVNDNLWPYLQGFKARATGPQTVEYKVGEIFSEVKPKFASGYSLRDALELIDQLGFRSQAERHELSEAYEAKIARMGNAGRNGGEYYTPRALIRAIVQVNDPRIGERVYDGACGSAGFLCEAYDYMRPQAKGTTDLETLQTRTFVGREKKSLAYVIGVMNMILHGIEAPEIVHANTLIDDVTAFAERDRFDVVLANPPFGANERKEVSDPFPIRTGETAYLFLQHFIRKLKAGGRAAIVIKNTFLSNTDNASVTLRRELLQTCDLHTVLDMPQGTFQGAGVKTVVLFFERGRPTRRTWYYVLNPGRSLGKTNPLNDADMTGFVAMQRTKADGPYNWSVDVSEVDARTWDLSVRNPHAPAEAEARTPEVILAEIASLDADTTLALERVRALL